jgi:hypothetical protein
MGHVLRSVIFIKGNKRFSSKSMRNMTFSVQDPSTKSQFKTRNEAMESPMSGRILSANMNTKLLTLI